MKGRKAGGGREGGMGRVGKGEGEVIAVRRADACKEIGWRGCIELWAARGGLAEGIEVTESAV